MEFDTTGCTLFVRAAAPRELQASLREWPTESISFICTGQVTLKLFVKSAVAIFPIRYRSSPSASVWWLLGHMKVTDLPGKHMVEIKPLDVSPACLVM